HAEEPRNMPHRGHQIRVLTGGLGLIEHPQRALAHLGRVLLVHRVPSLLQERNETQADSRCGPATRWLASPKSWATRSRSPSVALGAGSPVPRGARWSPRRSG